MNYYLEISGTSEKSDTWSFLRGAKRAFNSWCQECPFYRQSVLLSRILTNQILCKESIFPTTPCTYMPVYRMKEDNMIPL